MKIYKIWNWILFPFLGFWLVAAALPNTQFEKVEQNNADLSIVAKNARLQIDSDLDEKIAKQIEQIPNVRKVEPGLILISDLILENGPQSTFIVGLPFDSFRLTGIELLYGRKFKKGERRVILLNDALAKGLKRKVGNKITVIGEPFQIIGIYKTIWPSDALVPITDLQEVAKRQKRVTGFDVFIKAPNTTEVVALVQKQIESLHDPNGKPLGLTAIANKR